MPPRDAKFSAKRSPMPDAAPVDAGMQVDGNLRAPAVGRPLPGGSGVGIAQNPARLLPDQPGELGHMVPEPFGKLLHRRHFIFKGIGGVFHIGRINVQHGNQVIFCCITDHRYTSDVSLSGRVMT